MSEKPPIWVLRLKPMFGGLLVVVLLQGLAGGKYGFFRDELYYLSNARSLAWGYVDHPPLSVWVLRGWIDVFGDAVLSVRALSLLVSVASIAAIGALTRELYDDDRTVALATLATAAMPVLRVVGTLYSPNTFDLLWWSLSILVWVRCVRRQATSWQNWALLGLLLGLTILNRLSGLWLCAALVVSTVTACDVRKLAPAAWLAPLIAVAVISPWVVWQWEMGWPTLEFVRNANAHKLLPVSPWQFIGTQIVVSNPVVSALWIAALWAGWRNRQDRALVAGFCCVALILLVNGRSRENYLSPAYAFVLPLGAHLLQDRSRWLSPLIAVTGVVFGLICLPILPAPALARVLAAMPSPPSAEKGEKSVLQGLSDTVGWPEMARSVAAVWPRVPPGTALMAHNYGEAAALQYYGREYGLPMPICTHNQFWLPGYGSWDGRAVLFVGELPARLRAVFPSVRLLGQADSPWAVPEEAHASLWLLTGGSVPPAELWARLKRFE